MPFQTPSAFRAEATPIGRLHFPISFSRKSWILAYRLHLGQMIFDRSTRT